MLVHPLTAKVTRVNSEEVVELFDGGRLPLDEGLSQTRVIIARHCAPAPGKKISVGKRIGKWVYEFFITTLPSEGFLVEDVLDLYHGRDAFEAVLADERISKRAQIVGAPTPRVGRNCGRWPFNGSGTCASHLEKGEMSKHNNFFSDVSPSL